MDAIAITIATDGKAIGLAALGTSLTDEQAAGIHALGRTPAIAMDADNAGRVAAERDYWILAPYGVNARHVRLPDGTDPAGLMESSASDTLAAAVETAGSLACGLVDALLRGTAEPECVLDALRVVAAQPPRQWAAGTEHIAEQSGLPVRLLEAALVALTREWNRDPRHAAEQSRSLLARVETPVTSERVESRGLRPHDAADRQLRRESHSTSPRP